MLSFVLTMLILFGGWYLYQQLEVKEPLKKEVQQMTSAMLGDLVVSNKQVDIKLKVTNPELFPQEYQKLLKTIEERTQNKQLDIEIMNQDEQLKNIWANGQFAVNEAMELHQYSRIPQLLHVWKQTYKLDVADAKMDDTHIYVYLKSGNKDFYTMMPRTATNGEVTLRV